MKAQHRSTRALRPAKNPLRDAGGGAPELPDRKPQTVNPMKKIFSKHSLAAGLLACAIGSVAARAAVVSTNAGFTELDIVSDNDTNALQVDARLVNPWGIVAALNSVWVNDNHTGLVTTYNSLGKAGKTTVNVPAPAGGAGAPTGLAANNSQDFMLTNGAAFGPATYLICTEDGTLVAWNAKVNGSNAVIKVDNSGVNANYKGLAIARSTNGTAHVYLANFRSGLIDEYDGQFNFVRSFTDPDLPGHFVPFNLRTIRGRLFVTFAFKQNGDDDDDTPGPGNGFVDIFDTDGTMLRRFASQGALDSPWGMAIAPKNFGKFSHALLVGNFGDGLINAYDLLTGKWLGNLKRSNGDDVQIPGLWGLTFEKDEVEGQESNFIAQRLYFTAGIHDEEDGLLGILRPVSPSFPPAR
jgi:uncharacterized protein (TIGR03118 family)